VYDKSELTVPYGMQHRVGRVLSFFSSRRNWDFPNPAPTGECEPPWFWGEEHTRWRQRGWESPNFEEGTYTVVLFIYMSFMVCRMEVSRRVWACPTLSSLTALRQEITAPQTETTALCVWHLLVFIAHGQTT